MTLSPRLSLTIEDRREQLALISKMMIDACQSSMKRNPESRRFFGLETAESDILCDMWPDQIDYISHSCMYVFRPARTLGTIMAKGQTTDEITLTNYLAKSNASINVVGDLRIMWAAYVTSVRQMICEQAESWPMAGISIDDASALTALPPSAILKIAQNGPYYLTPSITLRGLLNPRPSTRPEELLRRCAIDMLATRTVNSECAR
jgi:hypothetical protein